MDDLYTRYESWRNDIWGSVEYVEAVVGLGTLIFLQQMRALTDCLAVEDH